MRAGETTLAGLLDGKKQFQVPLFQRPYSWQEEQLKQLWIDILEQAELIAEGTDGSTHFLGSVVHAHLRNTRWHSRERWSSTANSG
ncbi:MAG: hypothetical protein AUG49_13175 [Catenulispora sp. 13_1_20CM_3_70_7]|nr:MAG: hypothetical protein AUG49_13175 [Catenulispora sp. 13_1_20CM_3_70_7]